MIIHPTDTSSNDAPGQRLAQCTSSYERGSNNAPPQSRHTSPVPAFPLLKRPSVPARRCLKRIGREPRRGARPDPLEAEKRTEHALVATAPEQVAQIELNHLARRRDPRPVEAQQLVTLDAGRVQKSRTGQARDRDRKER